MTRKPTRLLLVALGVCAIACDQSSTSSSSGSSTPSNVQPIVVNGGPTGDYFNGGFTSVTICPPGSRSCQTLDGLLVDTGSMGLRVLRSALTVSLTQQSDANGNPIAECGQFIDGF